MSNFFLLPTLVRDSLENILFVDSDAHFLRLEVAHCLAFQQALVLLVLASAERELRASVYWSVNA